MWSGEIMDKTLRLKAEETPEINPDTIVGEDIKQLMIALPNCANSTIGAIELGVITSILWQYLGAASLICFASFIGEIQVGYVIFLCAYEIASYHSNIVSTIKHDPSPETCM